MNPQKETTNKKKKSKFGKIRILIILQLLLVFLIIGGVGLNQTQIGKGWFTKLFHSEIQAINQGEVPAEENQENSIAADKEKQEQEHLETERLEKERLEKQFLERENILKLVQEADRLASGYDYEKAIQLIQSYKEDVLQEPELQAAIERYTAAKASLIPYEGKVSHVFFHSLIADNSKAFDNDGMSNGYNYWMTTVSEFKKMLEIMYEKGYVLVSIRDMAGKTKVDGKTVMKEKEIKLPPGKIPFVLSQDDVNYYEYMKTDGFASKLVIDKDGNSANEINLNGEVVIGREYDVIPILDAFVEEHPDFSYKGAKGIIAVTGYEGTLGYRTNDKNSKTYEADKKEVKKAAKELKKKGWEFASHSYGHPHMGTYPVDRFKRDGGRWKEEVEELVGKTDIYIYPFGEEIEYNGTKYQYLKSLGFNYFCGVYAKPWIEVTDDYVRMTRRNLDGFTMHFYPDRLKDLFEPQQVFDKERPDFK